MLLTCMSNMYISFGNCFSKRYFLSSSITSNILTSFHSLKLILTELNLLNQVYFSYPKTEKYQSMFSPDISKYSIQMEALDAIIPSTVNKILMP